MRNITFNTKYFKHILLFGVLLTYINVSGQIQLLLSTSYSELANGYFITITDNTASNVVNRTNNDSNASAAERSRFSDDNTLEVTNGTINDRPPGDGIEFTNTDVIAREGSDAFAVFNVTLTGTITENVTVDYATNDATALNNEDYDTTTGTLTFTPTENSAQILVAIIDDLINEPTEVFTVVLSNIQSNLGIVFADGNTTNTANANINDDDAGDILAAPYDETLIIDCGDEIPEVPTLIFTGGCGDYTVNFTETEDVSSNDYLIIRTWSVSDSCDNTVIFEQVILIQQRDIAFIDIDICIEDEAIDLKDYLPEGFDSNGSFAVTQGEITLDTSLFNPNNLELGDYLISYEAAAGICNYNAEFTIIVNANCLPCDINKLKISTAITVNGDGINDAFEISGLDQCEYTYNLQVFNRWGTKIYESLAYRNNWGANAPGGSFGSNSIVPTGTYYYIITLSDPEVKPINGYVFIGSN